MKENNRKYGALSALLAMVTSSLMIVDQATQEAGAVANEIEHFTYETNDDGIIITGLSSEGEEASRDDGEIIIPESINDTNVISISDHAFQNDGLSKITFPSTSLTSIGEYAFQGNQLTELNVNVLEIGNNAFSQNQLENVTLTGTERINIEAFRDNNIVSLALGDKLTSIDARAFINNKLENVEYPDTLRTISDEAFSVNNIREVTLPDGFESLGANAFARNQQWVKVTTESDNVTTIKYDSGYGHVVNPVTIEVSYVDTNGNEIQPIEILGDDLNDQHNVYGRDQENTLTVKQFNDYDFVRAEVDGVSTTSTPVKFNPNRDNYPIKLVYNKVDKTPRINFDDTYTRYYDNGAVIDKEALLRGVTAQWYDTNNKLVTAPIDRIEVSPEQIDSTQAGTHTVYYKITDQQGRSTTIQQDISVGINWGKVEIGGGWLIEDFTYNGNNITGFSTIGNAKLAAGNTALYLPTNTITGQIANGGVAASGFRNKKLTSIESWGNITRIDNYAFYSNQLTSLPDDWGNITTISHNAFSSNQLTSLPDDWGNITRISSAAFQSNQLTSLPDDWGNITTISDNVFRSNKLTSVPDDWGNITRIDNYAFQSNQLTSLPDDWGNITTISDNVFRSNKLTSLPDDWGNITNIGNSAFQTNQLTSLPDDWGNITSIGNSAFQTNQLTSLPDDWGNITSISSEAFQSNQLTSVPDDWGNITRIDNYAFRSNKLTSLPDDWGNITNIGNSAFRNNKLTSLPDDWGNITNIDGSAFSSNQLTSLPDDWGNITNIDGSAFQTNQLTSLPDDWGNITNIGNSAFQTNQLTSLPDDWGNITTIGNYAFSSNQLTSLPDDWGNITTIGNGTFSSNQLTSLPDDWGNITNIDGSAFSSNQLTSLPDDWGNITTIGNSAFRTNQLTSLPDDWGNITNIDGSAFSSNQLTSLPDDWGNITSIGNYAFSSNQLTSLPDDWGNITTIGTGAFQTNQLPIGLTFTIPDANLTKTFFNGLDNSSIPKSTINPIIIYTEDRTNPNSVSSSSSIWVNPKKVIVEYVDQDGEQLAPPSEIITIQESYDLSTPEPRYGYRTPQGETIELNQDETIYTFTYVKMTEEEIAASQRGTITISTGINGNKNYYIGDVMTGNVRIDLTGYDDVTLVNPTIRVDFKEFGVMGDNVTVNSTTSIPIRNLRIYDNYFTFQYNKTMYGGTTVEIPFEVNYQKGSTPTNVQHEVQATLIDTNSNQPVALSNTDYYTGYYNQPYMNITANGSNYRGAISDYDQTIVDRTEQDSHVSDTGKNTITYNVGIYNLDRNVSDYTVNVNLPTYRVHEASGVTPELNDNLNYAVFDPEENQGWVLDEDTKVLTYTGNNRNTVNNINTARLVLHYPGSEENYVIPLAGDAVLTPADKPDAEPYMLVNDNISNYFYKWVPPVGEVFVKRAIGPQENGIYFYDNMRSKTQEFGWGLSYNATSDLHNVRMTDYKLDDRMYYSKVFIPSNFGAGVITALDNDGATLWTYRFDGTQAANVEIPENIGRETGRIIIRADGTLVKGTSGMINLYTLLKDPENVHYDPTEGSTANRFNNSLLFESDEVNGEVSAQKVIRALDQRIQAVKTSNFGNENITGDRGTYTVGYYAAAGYGEDITNFEQIDLLPRGIEVINYGMSNTFASIPGAEVRLVPNYNNTGQDAVIWTAPLVPYDKVTPKSNFIVGSITTSLDISIPTGQFVNDTFVRADNAIEMNPVEDPRLPTGEWSKAQVSNDVNSAALLSQYKQIRKYDADDNPLNWTQHVETKPGEKIDYRLRVINGTDQARTGLVMYDVFPFIGDLGIGGLNEPLPRESEFANAYDTSRQIQLPDGMIAQYYNSDVPVPEYNASNALQVLSALTWSDTPAANTRAIRIISEPGTSYTLGSRETVEVIVPMVANSELKDGLPGVPSDETVGRTAWNSFYQADDQQGRLIEGNRVSNTMVREPINIEFLKTGMTGGLAGATFEYRRDDDTVVKTVQSGVDGMVRFIGIIPVAGDKIVETQAPRGYVVNDEVRIISEETIREYYTSDNDGVLELPEFRNNIPWLPLNPAQGDLQFTKIDADGEPLQGVVFTLTRNWTYNGNNFSSYYEATSNENGVVSFKNVGAANGYVLTETKAPNRLQPIDPITDISIRNNETTYLGETVNSTDNAIVNDRFIVPITKLGVLDDMLLDDSTNTPKPFGEYDASTGARLSGATLELRNKATGEVVQTITTDNTVEQSFTNLESGVVYEIVETEAPTEWLPVDGINMSFQLSTSGQLLDENGDPFRVQSGIFVPNRMEPKLSSVVLTKRDNANTLLPGVGFTLERQDGDNWVTFDTPDQTAQQITDDTGIVSWSSIPEGNYRLRETVVPDGYTLNTRIYNFTVERYNSRTFTANYTNIEIDPSIRKVEYIARGLTQVAAQAVVAELDNATGVEIIRNGQYYDVVKPLTGAVFALRTSPNGADLEILTTGDDGYARITTPLVETTQYYLAELIAPEGYVLRNDPVQFNVSSYSRQQGFDGRINLNISNQKETGRLVISKINSTTGESILTDNVTFEVTSADGSFTRQITTDADNGVALLEDIPFGEYTVREIAAPDGYLLNSNPILFTVSREQATFTHIFGNDPMNPVIELTKYINGNDANTELTAPLLNSDDNTMMVEFIVENNGNTPLYNVTLTDVVTAGGEAEKINDLIRNAEFTVENNENQLLGTNNDPVVNGQLTLIPGSSARISVEVETPDANTLHTNNATVTGTFEGDTVTDEDPANAYKLDVNFPLPRTGAQGLVITGLIFIVLLGASIFFARRR